MAELHKPSQYCEYGNSLNFMLRDRLVGSTNYDQTQQRLLSEGANLSGNFTISGIWYKRSSTDSKWFNNRMKQNWTELNRKLLALIIVQSVSDVTIYTFRNHVHSKINNFFLQKQKLYIESLQEKKSSHHYRLNNLPILLRKLSWTRIQRMIYFHHINHLIQIPHRIYLLQIKH